MRDAYRLELIKARGDVIITDVALGPRQCNVVLEVTRFRCQQAGIKSAKRLGQTRRNFRKTLARTCFDQRPDQSQVQQPVRFMRAYCVA